MHVSPTFVFVGLVYKDNVSILGTTRRCPAFYKPVAQDHLDPTSYVTTHLRFLYKPLSGFDRKVEICPDTRV